MTDHDLAQEERQVYDKQKQAEAELENAEARLRDSHRFYREVV